MSKNVPKKCTPIIGRSPPEYSRVSAGGVFLTNHPRLKKSTQNSILPKNVAAKWAPGNPRGGLGGPLGHPWGALGGPRGAVGDPKSSLGDPLLQTDALTKSLVLPHEWVHFGCQRGLGGIILEEVVDQS